MLGNGEKYPLPIAKTMSEFIQHVLSLDGELLAYIVRANFSNNITSFVTPPEHNFQLGFVVHPQSVVIQSHLHKTIDRHISSTSCEG